MHAGQHARSGVGEAFDLHALLGPMREIVELCSQCLARRKNIRFHERLVARARLREKVAAEEGARLQVSHFGRIERAASAPDPARDVPLWPAWQADFVMPDLPRGPRNRAPAREIPRDLAVPYEQQGRLDAVVEKKVFTMRKEVEENHTHQHVEHQVEGAA